jgi:hypothetical protein
MIRSGDLRDDLNSSSVHHEGRHLAEKFPQERGGLGVQGCGVEGVIHQAHPAIARPDVDGKRHVAHAEPRVAALLDVAGRAAKAADQEVAEPHFRGGEVLGRIHRAQDVVTRNLRVEGTHQAREALLADARVDLIVGQIHNRRSMPDEAPKSAYELAMERLRRKDAEQGVEERAVTDEQKAEIAEVKRVYQAKLAEAEILFKSKIATVFEPEERTKLTDGHRRDLQRLNDDRERKLAKIRG